jgi:hypothetical protein
MEQNWWSSDWIKYFIGWAIGIPSGIVANWLYDKIKVWSRREKEYMSTSYSKGLMKFEGQYPTKVSIQSLMEQLSKPLPEKPSNQQETDLTLPPVESLNDIDRT